MVATHTQSRKKHEIIKVNTRTHTTMILRIAGYASKPLTYD